MKTWPYKVEMDNIFRAATEFHVFIVITVALVLKNDLSWEPVGVDTYDYFMFFSFVILVPGAFVVAVISKLVHIRRVLAKPRSIDNSLEQRQLAFDLQVLGLAEHSHRRVRSCPLLAPSPSGSMLSHTDL